MKKLYTIIAALMISVSAAWADVTVTISDQTDLAGITDASTSEATATHKYGTYSGSDVNDKPYYTTFTSNATSGLAGVTLSTTAKIIKPTFVGGYNVAHYGHLLAINYDKADEAVYTFTLKAPDGYYIKRYSFTALSTSDQAPFNITPLGQTTQTAKGYLYKKTCTADVYASTATFTVQRASNNNANYLCIPTFTVILAPIPTYDGTFTSLSINGSTGSLGHTSCGNEGSTSWYCLWTSTSVPSGLTLTTGERNNMQQDNEKIDIHSSYSPTYTLTAPAGYVISGYTIALYAGAAGSKITPSGGDEITISTDASNPTYVCVTGLSTKSTTFTRTGTSTNGYATTFIVYLRPAVGITYVVKNSGGTTLYTSDPVEIESGTTITTLPEAFKRDFCTYNEVNVTADAEKNVEFTATWEGPFEISETYAAAHWYDMSVRSTWYVTSDNVEEGALKTVNANALGLATDPYQWAFVGNPYNLKLYNKDKGEDYVYAWTSAANQNVPTFVSAATGNTWTIKRSTASGYEDAFLFTIPDYGYQVNQFGGEGGSLKVWNSTVTNDGGSAFKVFDVPDDFAEYVATEIAPYMENSAQYFNWTAAARTNIGYDDSYKTSCSYQKYADMKTALTTALSNLNSNVTFPEPGYYRIKNRLTTESYGYMGLNGTQLVGNISDINDLSTIIHVTKSGDKYYLQTQGKYTGNVRKDEAVSLVDDAPSEAFAMEAQAIGYAALRTWSDGPYSYYHAAKDKSYNIVGWENSANASQWEFEDAETVDITLTPANDNTGTEHTYATLCVPFNITGLTRTDSKEVKAYCPTISNDNIVTGEGATTIAAGTPVVLIGESGATSVTATIGSDYATTPATTNALMGTFTGTSINCKTNYVLGFDEENNNRIGFYHVNNTAFALKANRAYLSESAGGSNGFALVLDDDDPTAIASAINGQILNGQYYDLQGRKVANPQKGQIYIQNGKKVLF